MKNHFINFPSILCSLFLWIHFLASYSRGAVSSKCSMFQLRQVRHTTVRKTANFKKAYSLFCQVQCESDFLAAASRGGVFENKDVFESNSRLADTLSQQFEDKSLSALRFYCTVEKPGGSVIVISLQMNFFSHPQYTPPTPSCFSL